MLDISHGLQTPLTIMKGELGLLKKQGYDNKKIESIDRSIDRISTFIYQLLALAHLDTSEKSLRTEKLNLSELVHNLSEDLSVIAHKNNILLTCTTTSPKIVVIGRKDKLEDLVTNIVGNAIKYMSPDSQKIIQVEVRQTASDAILTIRDTGIGIEKHDLPHIFNRFYRAEDSDLNEAKGAGLGLAICKKIVDIHNGTIHAESLPGKGSAFIITIPLSKN